MLSIIAIGSLLRPIQASHKRLVVECLKPEILQQRQALARTDSGTSSHASGEPAEPQLSDKAKAALELLEYVRKRKKRTGSAWQQEYLLEEGIKPNHAGQPPTLEAPQRGEDEWAPEWRERYQTVLDWKQRNEELNEIVRRKFTDEDQHGTTRLQLSDIQNEDPCEVLCDGGDPSNELDWMDAYLIDYKDYGEDGKEYEVEIWESGRWEQYPLPPNMVRGPTVSKLQKYYSKKVSSSWRNYTRYMRDSMWNDPLAEECDTTDGDKFHRLYDHDNDKPRPFMYVPCPYCVENRIKGLPLEDYCDRGCKDDRYREVRWPIACRQRGQRAYRCPIKCCRSSGSHYTNCPFSKGLSYQDVCVRITDDKGVPQWHNGTFRQFTKRGFNVDIGGSNPRVIDHSKIIDIRQRQPLSSSPDEEKSEDVPERGVAIHDMPELSKEPAQTPIEPETSAPLGIKWPALGDTGDQL